MTRENDDRREAAATKRAALRKGRIDDASRRRLGQNLRLFYASVLEQPLPERFTQLLAELSAQGSTAALAATDTSQDTDSTSREGS